MRKKIIKHSLSKFENEELLQKTLDETRSYYRPLDPGFYLYNKIIEFNIDQKFNYDFIELLYVTLAAWNMNSRGAKLQDFQLFKQSILDHKNDINIIQDATINTIQEVSIISKLKSLFYSLDLVAKSKPALVTFSKTMHFLLPKLVVPIDRKYTLMYFYENVNIPDQHEKQFEIFQEIETEYSKFAIKKDLSKYIDRKWNTTETKVMDNMIIGFNRMKKR